MKEVIILGSTGSIGTQALEICQANSFTLKGIAANSNVKLAEQQARQFTPEYVAMADAVAAKDLKQRIKDTNIKVLSGQEGVCELASQRADSVLNSIVGIAGLRPTLSAIDAGNDIALANKETLVTGGKIVKECLKKRGITMLPVDSEHSAIFQSLQGCAGNKIEKIILTASGGPFYNKTRAELESVTVEQALKHPNWTMGRKITIDSATLMNKGLEVIEAVHLFDVKPEQIEVLIHRQSIVHSGVEFEDGAIIAQLGTPDMKLPIQYALTYPERLPLKSSKLNLLEYGTLTFEKPDVETFRALRVSIDAIKAGGLKPTALNGANEQAVALFLEGKIKFLNIADLVEKAVLAQDNRENFTVDDIFEADAAARQAVLSYI